jgi:hypothetical protein
MTKRCPKCSFIKPASEFYADKNRGDGRSGLCKQCSGELRRKWIARNPDYPKQWREKNRNRYNETAKSWREANPEKAREACRKSDRKRLSTPQGRLNNNMSCAIWTSLKGNKGRVGWEKLVGYDRETLKKHIERSFLPGMSWENYGEWHIDHKIPLAAFNFGSPADIDFQKAWGLNNLQPLWKLDNLSKKDKLLRPFQPSLTYAKP